MTLRERAELTAAAVYLSAPHPAAAGFRGERWFGQAVTAVEAALFLECDRAAAEAWARCCREVFAGAGSPAAGNDAPTDAAASPAVSVGSSS